MATYCPNCLKFVNEADPVSCPYCGQSLKKKKDNPIYTRFPFIVIAVFIFVIGAVTILRNTAFLPGGVPAAKTSPATTARTIEETTQRILNLDQTASGVEKALTNFGFQCSLSYDETGITVDATYKGLESFASAAVKYKGNDLDDWNELVDSFADLVESVQSYANTVYGSSIPVNVCVFSDQNKDNVLIMFVDSKIVYDAVNGKR